MRFTEACHEQIFSWYVATTKQNNKYDACSR